MLTALPTFRRYILPPFSGSNCVEIFSINVILVLVEYTRGRKSGVWWPVRSHRVRGQGNVIKGGRKHVNTKLLSDNMITHPTHFDPEDGSR
jgi:hypothetical protein